MQQPGAVLSVGIGFSLVLVGLLVWDKRTRQREARETGYAREPRT